MKTFAYAALVVGAGATSLKSCSDLGWHSFATTGKLICAASYCDGKFFDESQGFRQQAYTSDRMTLADNKDYCSRIGARMCTFDEVKADASVSPACHHNNKEVWTSDTCNDGVTIAKYSIFQAARSIKEECVSSAAPRWGQCCADRTGTERANQQAMGETPAPTPLPNSQHTKESCFSLGWTRTLSWDDKPKSVCGASFCGGVLTDSIQSRDERKQDAMAHENAEKLCAATGSRLCTADEVVGDMPHGNNCWTGRTRVWSATPCDGGFEAVWTTRLTPTEHWTKQCTAHTAKLNVRCCATTISKNQVVKGGDLNTMTQAGAKTSKVCPLGKFFAADNELIPCVHCPAGKYGVNSGEGGSCEGCGFGFYMPFFGKDNCLACANGLYANAERTACGEAMVDITDAMTCTQAGKYKNADTRSCTNCPSGTYGVKGAYSLDATCKKCASETFAASEGATSCATCAAGRYGTKKRMTCSDIKVGDCPAGSFHSERDPDPAECAPCAAGTFGVKNAKGIGECRKCAEGYTSATSGALECTKCPANTYSNLQRNACTSSRPACAPGTFDKGGYCHGCPVGKFGSFKILSNGDAIELSKTETACYKCAPGSFSNKAGKLECTPCGTGMYSSEDATACTKRRECKNGPVTVKDGWRGPGYGPNYCNFCKCSDTALLCSKQACRGYGQKKQCSHVTCELTHAQRWDGSTHKVVAVKHKLAERNGHNLFCGYSLFADKCQCLCSV
jgi:hypothetical protein